MQLTGKIINVSEIKSGKSKKTGSEWQVQEYVLETTGDQYPRHCMFSVFGADKIQQFNIKLGDEVRVDFDIDAHEYNGRWYNSIRAWRVESALVAPQAAPADDAPQTAPADPTDAGTAPADNTDSKAPEDDLPF